MKNLFIVAAILLASPVHARTLTCSLKMKDADGNRSDPVTFILKILSEREVVVSGLSVSTQNPATVKIEDLQMLISGSNASFDYDITLPVSVLKQSKGKVKNVTLVEYTGIGNFIGKGACK